jgi:hypothetical protein
MQRRTFLQSILERRPCETGRQGTRRSLGDCPITTLFAQDRIGLSPIELEIVATSARFRRHSGGPGKREIFEPPLVPSLLYNRPSERRRA